jgi:hypothetical protein
MASEQPSSTDEQDWRLQAKLDSNAVSRSLQELIGRLRGEASPLGGIKSAVPHEVVVTHDGGVLFAYAPNEEVLLVARQAIETVLSEDGIEATVQLSHWDDDREKWQQTGPPLGDAQVEREEKSNRVADAIETRTLVANAGRLIRAEFEQTMLNWADKLDLQCEIFEHPHLLITQVGFTVTGPKHKIDEFTRGLKAEGRMMVRTETGVMLSPL